MYIMRKKNNITKRKDLYIMDLNDKQKNFIDLCYKEFGDDLKEITRQQLVTVEKKYKVAFPQWLVANKDLKVSKGVCLSPKGIVIIYSTVFEVLLNIQKESPFKFT